MSRCPSFNKKRQHQQRIIIILVVRAFFKSFFYSLHIKICRKLLFWRVCNLNRRSKRKEELQRCFGIKIRYLFNSCICQIQNEWNYNNNIWYSLLICELVKPLLFQISRCFFRSNVILLNKLQFNKRSKLQVISSTKWKAKKARVNNKKMSTIFNF